MSRRISAAVAAVLGWSGAAGAQTPLPDAIAASGEATILVAHAEGAQVYACRSVNGAAAAWSFREPIATLMRDGETIGRHFAGPTWELDDSSIVAGKVVGKAAGATPSDIPWLKLEITSHRGAGALSEAATVQRINTQGGALEGPCAPVGATRAVAYSADYVFLKK